MTFKQALLLAVFCLLSITTHSATANYNVVPLPQSIIMTKGKPFVLNESTAITCTTSNELMQHNAHFLAEYIADATGIKLAHTTTAPKGAGHILLTLDNKIAGKEAYRITVTQKQVTIAGSTAAGVFYGIQTLRKSLPVATSNKAAAPVELPAVQIADAPLLPYRGMMLDCGRHFFPVSFVKRFIDMMALHNMNAFHWHLSEDQGWRIEIKKYPKLMEVGAWRSGTVVGHNSDVDDHQPHGGFYTQEEIKQIVEYARQRHIEVIPEIDIPGHTKALLAAYPELGCTGGPYTVGHNWGVHHDVLCVGNERVYAVLQDIIDELNQVFPSAYFNIGGDEAPSTRWQQCKRCQDKAKEQGIDTKHLQQYFTKRMEQYINGKGKTMIGWDEILEGELAKSTIVLSRRYLSTWTKAAKAGHNVITCPGKYAYFDYYQTKNLLHEPQAIGGYLPVEQVYSFNPRPDTVSADITSRIIGVQGNLWTEYVPTTAQAEYMVLPRMAALAEVQWMPASRKNYTEFVERVTHLARLYDHYGYTYALHIWPERYNHNRADW